MKRRICIFTSTRAEWGLLKGVAELVDASPVLELQLLVSGTHLSDRHGMTINEIGLDGFKISAEVDICLDDDSPVGICKTMGVAFDHFGEVLGTLQPDVLVVLGDRYETFCVVASAQVMRVPVAHIHGGETTEGAIDEAFRHSITKMSHIHFPACEAYRKRIIQLGEDPSQVHNVGALGLENIRNLSFMSKSEIEDSLDFKLDAPFFLVTFHPVTLENATAGEHFSELLDALDHYPQHKVIFTKANADPDGQVINDKIEGYTALHPERCLAVDSLGLRRYLSAMRLCDAVVGNSSSGLLETPAFNVPTVNIGDRQRGRIRAVSVVDCEPDNDDIVKAISLALDPVFKEKIINQKLPFTECCTASEIVKILQRVNLGSILKKRFFDLNVEVGTEN